MMNHNRKMKRKISKNNKWVKFKNWKDNTKSVMLSMKKYYQDHLNFI